MANGVDGPDYDQCKRMVETSKSYTFPSTFFVVITFIYFYDALTHKMLGHCERAKAVLGYAI